MSTSSTKLDLLVEESSQFRPHLKRFRRPSSETCPEWKRPLIGPALDIGRAKAAARREPSLHRDHLLEFDRGDLSRTAQTVENWFGEPMRFSLLDAAAWN